MELLDLKLRYDALFISHINMAQDFRILVYEHKMFINPPLSDKDYLLHLFPC